MPHKREDYEVIEIWIHKDDPLLDFLRKKAINGECLGKVVKRELRRVMFMDRFAEMDKRVDSALRVVHRKMRELGVPA